MRIKADRDSYMHEIRARQFAGVFGNLPKGAFGEVLELGAGDGFVSTLLADYAQRLISTDLNADRLKRQDYNNVTYKICDAEDVGATFAEKQFDLVFSSNLLEHLGDYTRALHGIHCVLKDDGITIHYLPNRWWKLTTVLLHIPNKVSKFIDRVLSGQILRKRRHRKPHRPRSVRNNPKLGRRRRQFFLTKLFLPRIHGVSRNTIAEFIAFGRHRWVKRFESCGFTVMRITKLGFSSGYAFGCPRVRRLLERMGVYTSYAYIACKQGCNTRYSKYIE